jgi:predicted transcriptional regulator
MRLLSVVQSPCLKLPLRAPRGPPDPFAPPCIRQRARPFRVDEVAARAKQDISRARSSAVILAFMAGAAALLGAIAAWAAAVTAGRYRDGQEAIPALWDWGSESRPLFSKNTR